MKIANGKGDKEKETTKSSTMMSCFVKSHKAEHDEVKEEMCKVKARKPGGWKSMPYILGNETFERLATIGVLANFMVYLQTQLHMKLVAATNLIHIWSGCSSFAPLLGAFISDAYLGRFRTIAFASIASLLGMGLLTLTAWIPQLHPPKCTPQQLKLNQCLGPTQSQLGVLLGALALLGIGAGGIRPCSIPFGVDQFDPTTEEGRRGISSFFNWYYATLMLVLLIALTAVVYIQNSVGWVLGFGILTGLMFWSIILFFFGTRVYVYVKPEGSVFTDIARVYVAAYKKRKVKLPETDVGGLYYDPPLQTTMFVSKLPLTNEFRVLNRAALITDGDLSDEGVPNDKWRLCSIQRIEEAKCLLRIIPVWASGIICFTSMSQQGTFTVAQALKMDRHLGPKFKIPPGSMSIISMITIGVFIPIYDRILVPVARRITRHEGGITLLQRIGIGMVFSILSMIVAGLVEARRRNSANAHDLPNGVSPMSVMWLAPQLVLMGLSEAFNIIGQIEFYNKQFPENMRSIGNSLLSVTMGGASYLSSAIVMIVHATAGKHGHPDWLANNINEGRVDYFYYIISVLGLLNMIYFVAVARQYQYKAGTMVKEDHKKESTFDTEMTPNTM
uniref:Nitrate transporter n=1 Tax=Kalanchoe fedtschenkoi TaxID=63787 RepID=A0A7N0TC45_KALFE